MQKDGAQSGRSRVRLNTVAILVPSRNLSPSAASSSLGATTKQLRPSRCTNRCNSWQSSSTFAPLGSPSNVSEGRSSTTAPPSDPPLSSAAIRSRIRGAPNAPVASRSAPCRFAGTSFTSTNHQRPLRSRRKSNPSRRAKRNFSSPERARMSSLRCHLDVRPKPTKFRKLITNARSWRRGCVF